MGMMEKTKATDECIRERRNSGPHELPVVNVKAIDGPVKEEDPHHFPSKLHRMLVDIDGRENEQKIVSWQPHGRCFLIKNQALFEQEIMPA